MPIFAGIHEGRVVALAECATIGAAKRCECLRADREIVLLPENPQGWSIASADAYLHPLPLAPEA